MGLRGLSPIGERIRNGPPGFGRRLEAGVGFQRLEALARDCRDDVAQDACLRQGSSTRLIDAGSLDRSTTRLARQ